MRIALVDAGDGSAHVAALDAALREAGHEPQVIRGRELRAPERLLHARGFTGPLTPVPAALAALLRGRFDVAHAFSAPDAAAALAWRRLRGGPVVFTCTEVLHRGNVADRRLRLRLLQRATEEPDAVLAANAEVAEAMWRWLALEAPVVEPAAHAALYEGLR